jgi:hypothetical protein
MNLKTTIVNRQLKMYFDFEGRFSSRLLSIHVIRLLN